MTDNHVPTGPNGRSFAPVSRARRQRQPLPGAETATTRPITGAFPPASAFMRREWAYAAANGRCARCGLQLAVLTLVPMRAAGTPDNPVPRLTAVCHRHGDRA